MQWTYLRSRRVVVDTSRPSDDDPPLVAEDVSPEHGPPIAAAPEMVAVLRRMLASDSMLGPHRCECPVCNEARAILGRIDQGGA